MAVYDYAESFGNLLEQKYAKELCSDALSKSNQQVTFINAQTIRLPRMTVSGYKDHTRTPGFNAGTLSNDWEPKKLEHDRDIEFFIDPMDIDETNLTLSVANIQNTFETGDNVTIKMVPAARMKSKYNFTDGCVAASDADQINMTLIHPSCVVCRDKYSYIKLFTPGTDSRTADGMNAHGWMVINHHWYYFGSNGKMLKGWFQINGEWYYGQPDGPLEGALYRSDSRGAMNIWYVD